MATGQPFTDWKRRVCRNFKTLVESNLHSVTDECISAEVFTQDEGFSIQKDSSGIFQRANRRFLLFLLHKSEKVYRKFLKCLDEGHNALKKILTADDVPEQTHQWRKFLLRNYTKIVNGCQLYEELDSLVEHEIFTVEEAELITNASPNTPHSKNREFMKILLPKSYAEFRRFLSCLGSTNLPEDVKHWFITADLSSENERYCVWDRNQVRDLKRNIMRKYDEIVRDTAMYTLCDDLVSEEILTIDEYEKIVNTDIQIDKNRQLLDILLRENSRGCEMLMEMLVTNGYCCLVTRIMSAELDQYWKDRVCRNFKNLVKSNLYSMTDRCITEGVFTLAEGVSVQPGASEITEAANRQFLLILLHKSEAEYDKFFNCLGDEHRGIKMMLTGEHVPNPSYDWRGFLLRNFKRLVSDFYVDMDVFLKAGILTYEETEIIKNAKPSTDHQRTREFIKILLTKSDTDFEIFLSCLGETDVNDEIKELFTETDFSLQSVRLHGWDKVQAKDLRKNIEMNYDEITQSTSVHELADEFISEGLMEIEDYEKLMSKEATEDKNKFLLDSLLSGDVRGCELLMEMLVTDGYSCLVTRILSADIPQTKGDEADISKEKYKSEDSVGSQNNDIVDDVTSVSATSKAKGDEVDIVEEKSKSSEDSVGSQNKDVVNDVTSPSPTSKAEPTGGSHYSWQIYLDGSWTSFERSVNDEIEREYCLLQEECITRISLAGTVYLLYVFFNDGHDTEAQMCNPDDVDEVIAERYKIRRLPNNSYATYDTDATQEFPTIWKWYWEDDGKIWKLFEPDELQYTLETKYLDGQKRYLFSRNFFQHKYKIDFQEFIQTNVDTTRNRRIRRRPVFQSSNGTIEKSSFSVPASPQRPPGWALWDYANEFELVEIDKKSAEYLQTEKRVYIGTDKNTLSISAIYRIQNMSLWKAFKERRQNITRDRQKENPISVEERTAFYGTDDIVTSINICRNGLDLLFSCKTDGLAEGVALPTRAITWVGPSADHKSDKRYLFLFKVLTGDQLSQGQDLKLKTFAADTTSDQLHLFIRDKHHCYPLYGIVYTNHEIIPVLPPLKYPDSLYPNPYQTQSTVHNSETVSRQEPNEKKYIFQKQISAPNLQAATERTRGLFVQTASSVAKAGGKLKKAYHSLDESGSALKEGIEKAGQTYSSLKDMISEAKDLANKKKEEKCVLQ